MMETLLMTGAQSGLMPLVAQWSTSTGSSANKIMVYDPNAEETTILQSTGYNITAAKFSRSGSFFAAIIGGRLHVYRVSDLSLLFSTGTEIGTTATNIAFSPVDNYVAVASLAAGLRVYSLADFSLAISRTAGSPAVEFSPDGEFVFSSISNSTSDRRVLKIRISTDQIVSQTTSSIAGSSNYRNFLHHPSRGELYVPIDASQTSGALRFRILRSSDMGILLDTTFPVRSGQNHAYDMIFAGGENPDTLVMAQGPGNQVVFDLDNRAERLPSEYFLTFLDGFTSTAPSFRPTADEKFFVRRYNGNTSDPGAWFLSGEGVPDRRFGFFAGIRVPLDPIGVSAISAQTAIQGSW